MQMHQRKTRAPARGEKPRGEFLPNTEMVLESFRELCKGVATPYAFRALRALDTGEFRRFLLSDIDPAAYYNPTCFHKDYLVHSYLKKFEGIVPLEDLKDKALHTFKQVESRNRIINRKFITDTPLERGAEPAILLAQRKISEILGEFSFDKVMTGCRWSGGATHTLAKRNAQIPNKMLEPLSCTSSLMPFAKALVQNDPHWLAARNIEFQNCLHTEVRIVDCEKYDTVPKTWKQRRGIAKQPTMNIFFQKGIGSYIRRRLKAHGIDLDDQTPNQMLARAAIHMGLATLDLSNASDTICTELVRLLLPPDWFRWLDTTRCRSILLPDGTTQSLQRFAAMGNGFAFELESLIFYALVHSSVSVQGGNRRSVVSIYGDDIICESKFASAAIDLLEQCGFVINTDKSFITGSFYESCGKHYFQGVDVTPTYQKKNVFRGDRSVCERLRAANRLLDAALVLGRNIGYDVTIKTAWQVFANPYIGRTYEYRYTNDQGIHFTRLPWSGPAWGDGSGYFKDPSFRALADINGIFYTVNAVTTYRETRVYGRAARALYAYELWKTHTSPKTEGDVNTTTASVESDSITLDVPVDKVSARRWYLQQPAHFRGLTWVRAAFDTPRSLM